MTDSSAGFSRPGSPRKRRRPSASELVALTEAGLAIVRSPLDVDALCALVYEQVQKIVSGRATSFHLGLFEGDRLTLKVWIQDGKHLPVTSFPGGQDTGIVGWLRAAQRPLLVRDFVAEIDSLPARPSYSAERPPRSALFVPLVAGDRVVGSMSVQNPKPNAFDEDDLQTLTIIGNQTASALVNAQLFRTVQRRAEQLAAIAEVGKAITVELDLDELLSKVVELIRERFGYYHVQIFLVEDEEHRAVFRASTGHDLNKRWLQEGRSQRFFEGIIGWVAATGEHVLANDISLEPRYIADDPRLLPGTRSELAMPLTFEGKVLGVLDVQSTDLNAFNDEDLFVLNALANQVAVTVDGAWAYRAQQEEAWMTTVLLQVAEVANRVSTLGDVLGAITRLVPMLAGVASSGIWLRDENVGAFEPAAGHGLAIPWDEAREQLRMPEAAQFPAITMLLQQLVPQELSKKDSYMLPATLWQALAGDEVILLPLLAQNRLIGCLLVSLDSERIPGRLHDKRLSMLSGIANQAAAAIENVRLSTAREEEAWTSWALLEVSQAVGTASSVDDMFEQVVRLTPLLAGVKRCAVLLRRAEGGDFCVVKTYDASGREATGLESLCLAAGDLPLLDRVVTTRRLQRVDDTARSDLVPAAWHETAGSKTLVVAPLLVHGDVRGALLVDDADLPHVMSERHEDILTGIARQVSLALENFQFQAQEEEHIRLAQELQLAQRIQASLLPSDTPRIEGYEIAHAWAAAREVGGDFYAFVALREGEVGLLMADVADKGVPAALFMATTSTLLRISAQDHTTPDGALLHANGWITDSNREDMFVTVWYGILDPSRHTVAYANAGHSLALHVQAGDGAIRQLRPSGMPLGVVKQLPIERDDVALAPGDLLVLYTDGVVDAIDEAEEEFGQDRLESVLYRSRDLPAQEVVDAVLAAVWEHTGDAPILDDITLWVLKRGEPISE